MAVCVCVRVCVCVGALVWTCVVHVFARICRDPQELFLSLVFLDKLHFDLFDHLID